MEYGGDDDALLDWEHYTRANTIRCCGRECTLSPPAWWYQTSKRKRRWMLAAGGCILAFSVLVLILAAAAVARNHFGSGSVSSLQSACTWVGPRLPPGIAPLRYNLSLDVQMTEPYLVSGEEDIEIMVAHPTKCVVLHASEMTVTMASLGGHDGVPARQRYNEELEQITLEWDDPLPQGRNVLHFDFQYVLREGMTGFYRSTMNRRGTSQILAVTQFEANSARTAFPCFDEPALKAVFSIEITAPKGLTVLSNMPSYDAHQHSKNTTDISWHFIPTPPMSTYLLAFIIGKLHAVQLMMPPSPVPLPPAASKWIKSLSSYAGGGQGEETQKEGDQPNTRENLPIRVYSIDEQLVDYLFALGTAAQVIMAYEFAFNTAYPLPKLDLVAIPDFSAGAMENWGLVTYREEALLVSTSSTEQDRRYVAKVVAHELAHQWFGDLVTMEWWNDLWLNEGFASYIEYLGATAAQPKEAYLDFYYTMDVPYAMRFDAKSGSHAMSLPATDVASTDRIESLFDPIEYERGGAVLRMLRAYMNRGNASIPMAEGWEMTNLQNAASDPLLAGLQSYLHHNSFNATNAAQLWSSLSTSTGVDLPALMEAWTYQPGYPVVTVSVDAKGGVWLAQAPYTLADGLGTCDFHHVWWIPISFVSSENPVTLKWGELNACQSLRPLIPALPKGGWVKVNARQYGYYRVNYSPELWSAATVAAGQRDGVNAEPVMRAVDYAGLLEDSFALAATGTVPPSTFLGMMKSLPERRLSDYAPWSIGLDIAYRVDALTGCQEQWRRFVRTHLLEPFQNNVSAAVGGDPLFSSFFYKPDASKESDPEAGKTGDGEAPPVKKPGEEPPEGFAAIAAATGERLLRPLILRAGGYFGSEKLVMEALMITNNSRFNSFDFTPELREAVYITAARFSPNQEEVFDALKQTYISGFTIDQRERALRALAHTSIAVPTALELALSEDARPKDIPMLVVTAAVSGSREKLQEAWAWYRANWEGLHERLGGDDEASRRMGQIMEEIASAFDDVAMVEEVDACYAQHHGQQSEGGYAERAKASILANARWAGVNGDAVCAWVAAELGESSSSSSSSGGEGESSSSDGEQDGP